MTSILSVRITQIVRLLLTRKMKQEIWDFTRSSNYLVKNLKRYKHVYNQDFHSVLVQIILNSNLNTQAQIYIPREKKSLGKFHCTCKFGKGICCSDKCNIITDPDCSWARTHNHLVRKHKIQNHLAKQLAK